MIIISANHIIPIQTDIRLRERRYGHWEGILTSEYDLAPLDTKDDVERDFEIQQRALACLTRIATEHPHEIILIATHAGMMRNLAQNILKFNGAVEDIKMDTAALLVIDFTEDQRTIQEAKGIALPKQNPPSFTVNSLTEQVLRLTRSYPQIGTKPWNYQIMTKDLAYQIGSLTKLVMQLDGERFRNYIKVVNYVSFKIVVLPLRLIKCHLAFG